MNILKGEVQKIMFVMIDSSGTEVTGLGTGFTLGISKAGAAFGASAGTKAEIGSGWYSYELTASETDTLGELAIKVTGSGAVQQNLLYDVVEDYWDTAAGQAILGSLVTVGSALDYRQNYCTVDELIADLDTPGGDIDNLLRFISAASQTIVQEIGNFQPLTEIRYLDGNGKNRLMLPPLIAIAEIIDDDNTLASTDYILYPSEKHWPNGPYTWIEYDPDGDYPSGVWTEESGVIKLTAAFGLFFLVRDTGLTVAGGGLNSSEATIAASDGSKLSPGMVLRIESEDIYISGLGSPTASVTTINGAMDASQETITFTDGSLVKVGEIIRVGVEKMKVADISGNSGYVRRGYHKTKPAAHTTSSAVDIYRTPTIVRGVNGTLAAAHTASKIIYRLMVPDDVNFLCREIATLMLKKAQSGYAGRTGNEQTGVTYYNDAFPKYDLERVREHYVWK